jgi:hypothetical protein
MRFHDTGDVFLELGELSFDVLLHARRDLEILARKTDIHRLPP